MDMDERSVIDDLAQKVNNLVESMQKMGIAEQVELVRSPKYMMFMNFLSGLARGLGVAVGATILGAIVLMLLFRLAELNVPVIGYFIAKIVKIVQIYL